MTNALNVGQLSSLLTALVFAILDLLAFFHVLSLDASVRPLIEVVCTTAVALGVYLFSLFAHQKAMILLQHRLALELATSQKVV